MSERERRREREREREREKSRKDCFVSKAGELRNMVPISANDSTRNWQIYLDVATFV